MRRLAGVTAAMLAMTMSQPIHGQGAEGTRTDSARPGNGAVMRPALQAIRAPVAPTLDGRLDDAIWQDAPVATGFVQRAPHPGEPATERTEARVVFTDDAIYVAIRAWDSAADSIASQLARRDATGIFSDWVDVMIDSYHDRRSAYRFSVNPHGVKKDIFHFNDGQEDISWDAVWDVVTSIDADGWTAEFRIPLSQIRYAPGEGEQTWGLQFGRTIARRDEVAFWAPILPGTPGFVSQSGTMSGVHGLAAPKRLEFMPYLVSKVTRAPEPAGAVANPFWRATDPAASFGADMKYGLTSNLTLTATFNPDFGQVEADPAVVNLGAFESFFPERRPFFLEGASLFTLDIGDDNSGEGLFYSRRIGRAPQRNGLGADHVDMPEAARILGAGKLTGRVGDWSIGFFNAVTRAEHAEVLRNGNVEETPVEPLTNYAVGRINRGFRNGGSTLGMLFTATNRRIDDDVFNFLRTSAYSAGLTGQHRFGEGRRYQLYGFLAASSIHGDTLAMRLAQFAPQRYYQRTDATHVDFDPDMTSMQGLTGRLELGRSGQRANGGIGGQFRTPGFDVNDVGFQQNSDQRFVYGWFNYNSYQPGPVFRRWNVGFNPNAGWDFGGTRLWSQLNTWGNATFNNFWSANFYANNRWAATSTTALRGGPALYSPGGNNYNLGFSTDRRKTVFASASTNGYREHETGVLRWGANAGLTARPSARFDISMHPGLNRHRNAWQYVSTPRTLGTQQPEYIFAELDQTTVSLTTRLNYTFSRDLSLQLYAQPFISAGEYTSFRRVADPRARAFDTRFHTFGGGEISREVTSSGAARYTATVPGANGSTDSVRFNDPDFTIRSLRSNAVLRWEYSPGSTLFLVWSHGRGDRTGTGAFDFSRGVDDLWRLQGTNVLMLKLNYWLNM